MKEHVTIHDVDSANVTVTITGVKPFTVTKDSLRELHRAVSGFVLKELSNNPHLQKNLARLTDILLEMDSILDESKQIQIEKEME